MIRDVTYKSLFKTAVNPTSHSHLLELIKIFGLFPSFQNDIKIIFNYKTYKTQRNTALYWPLGFL